MDRVLVTRLTVARLTVHNRVNNSPPPNDILSQTDTANSPTPMSSRFILILCSHALSIPVKLLSMHNHTLPSIHTSPHHTTCTNRYNGRSVKISSYRYIIISSQPGGARRGTAYRQLHSDLHCSPVFTAVIEITDDEMGTACRAYKEKKCIRMFSRKI